MADMALGRHIIPAMGQNPQGNLEIRVNGIKRVLIDTSLHAWPWLLPGQESHPSPPFCLALLMKSLPLGEGHRILETSISFIAPGAFSRWEVISSQLSAWQMEKKGLDDGIMIHPWSAESYTCPQGMLAAGTPSLPPLFAAS